MSSLFNIAAGGETEFYPFKIDNSLRFDDGSSTYLQKTINGNRQTYSISFWFKRGTMDATQYYLHEWNGSDTYRGVITINSGNTSTFEMGGSSRYRLITNQLFRDASAWYHVLYVADTTNSTSGDRLRMYVNGVRVTSFSTETQPTQNYSGGIGQNTAHEIGSLDGSSGFIDGYIAEFNYLDGVAVSNPTSFGETKSGVWIPKDTSGLTFGTNGFRLEFKNSSDIGNDTSGQDNDWSPNNLIAADVVSDSPTNNFATMNPVDENTFSTAFGNLRVNGSSSAAGSIGSTFFQSTGKWYVEMVAEDMGNGMSVGIKSAGEGYDWKPSDGRSVIYQSDGNKIIDGGSATSYGATYTVGDIIGLKINLDDGEIEFLKNNASQGNASTSLDSSLAFGVFFLDTSSANNARSQFNFGQDSSFHNTITSGSANASDANGHGDFYYSVPSGYLALVAENLPEPSISPLNDDIPEDYFDTVLWEGTGSAQSITGLEFSPDWVWLKNREHTDWHNLMDTVRTNSSRMASNNTNAEDDGSGIITSFDSSGFSVGSNSNSNRSGDGFVAWNWLAGGTPTATNSAGAGNAPTSGSVMIDGVASTSALAGTIAATKISANTESGFSIVAYTGNATAGATVAHGLGGTPEMMIVKRRGAVGNWFVYHHQANGPRSSDAETDYFTLETSNARSDNASPWNDTAPTSTVFTIGASGWTNSADTYIAYLFRSIEGFSKIAAYQGTGTTNNAYVYTGFRPRFILGRRSNASVNWFIHDTARDIDNYTHHRLFPDSSGAENSSEAESTYGIDFLSNGFKIRASHTSTGANDAYIYMAFAEMPFKYANAR